MGEDAVYNFINSMVEESKYCSDVTKNILSKNLAMTKKDLMNSTKCWICDKDYVEGSYIVRWYVKNIGDKEYEHVVKVWDKSEKKTMKHYHNFYLKRDVLLLADVFQ